jgi:hypothetical protein
MMKQEFEKLIDRKIPQDEYNIIEVVYEYYPTDRITNLTDKQICAHMYEKFGIRIFKDLLPRAIQFKDLYMEEQELQAKRVRLLNE